MTHKTIYQEHGFYDRADYLQCLSESYGVSRDTVDSLSTAVGGPSEDFGGLPDLLNAHAAIMAQIEYRDA